MRLLQRIAVACAVVIGLLIAASPASAHPLGRFTVNQYAGLRIAAEAVHVDYVVDLAELPAFQARSEQVDTDADGAVSPAEASRYAATACADDAGQLRVTVAGETVPLTVSRSAVTFPPGEGGLVTLRLECALLAAVTVPDPATVTFRNDAHPSSIGWREITATGDGFALTSSDVPESSVSGRLSAYPEDPLTSPSDVRSATVAVRASADAVPAGSALAAPRQAVDRLTAAFTGVVERQRLTFGLALLGIALAMVLGAAHALAPGHGKTVMAAVLVGERGTWRQAAVIAGSVTVTHTAGVLVLGATLATSVTFAPERLYGVLAAVSGVLLAGVGLSLLRRALRARKHPHHDHAHHGVAHDAAAPDPDAAAAAVHDHDLGGGRPETGPVPAATALPGQAAHHGAAPGPDAPAARHDHERSDDRSTTATQHGAAHAAATPASVVAVIHQKRTATPPSVAAAAHHERTTAPPSVAAAAHHGHGHSHSHGHSHPHGHGHQHGHSHHHGPISLRSLLTLGFAGGLLPSPSAVVVLLGAVALGRPWYGVLLVVTYGLGMAVALTSIGLALGRWGPALGRRLPQRLTRWRPAVPVLTAALIVLVGLSLTAQALLAQT
ncbi:sulfite exporter TauE/SafE family protein [Actinoplanes sp. NBC_00393]|uniref:urease accessory protein UreH domain-containing protein n=1 Tax=Actinoplanes sp. NBC_00393 TaxID=2975953 RepID=UPI002E2121A2